MDERFDLDGAVVLLTGSQGGIGSALRTAFASRGAVVVGADLPGKGADIDVDVADAAQVRDAVQRVVTDKGRIDVAVANAGVGRAGLMGDLDDDAWRQTMDVNYWGTVNLVRAAYPLMSGRGRGAIVLVASVSGLLAAPLLTPYAASKHAIIGFGASFAPEAARRGVSVTIACPGPVETPMLDQESATSGISVRRYLTAAAGPPLPPAKLAERIVSAVERRKFLLTPGRAGLLDKLRRLAPGYVQREQRKALQNELSAAGAGE